MNMDPQKKPEPGSYIDTQGMGAPLSPEERAKLKNIPQNHKPMRVRPRRLFTPEYVKEMKILINEVLDEREYNRRMKGAFDDIKHPGPSYFEVDHFKHDVGEEEPPYQDWSQP